ncbi:hypothetical protein [Methylobacterium sp. SI9]|uniref:hypothetical protein n=1 Tax=Methylobacterium guangdongense TaxID=3138811 RepID=UPI00313BADDD
MDTWNHIYIILESAKRREQALKKQAEEESEKVEALRIVVSALTASTGWFGLNRTKFKSLIANAARQTPNSGPAAIRHSVFLAESTRILCGDAFERP